MDAIPSKFRQPAAIAGGTVALLAMLKLGSGSSKSPSPEVAKEPQVSAVVEVESKVASAVASKPEVQTPQVKSAVEVLGKGRLARVTTDKAPQPGGPFSQGIKAGGFLFTCGQIAVRPGGNSLEDGPIEEQSRLALSNLEGVLTAAKCSKDSVVKTTVFLESMDDYAKMNEEYKAFFGDHRPARSAVQVAKLPRGAKVEIEAIARLTSHDIA